MINRDQWKRWGRAIKSARTYVKKAEDLLYAWQPEDLEDLPHGYLSALDYTELLDESLDLARAIIKKLPDDFFEETEFEAFFGLPGGRVNPSDDVAERVEKLTTTLKERRVRGKAQRRIRLLENVEGRTPEEAAAYQEKADQLRREAGLPS